MKRQPDLVEILPPGMPPMPAPVIVTGSSAIVQHPLGDHFVALPLLPAIHLAWQPLGAEGALLSLFFGADGERGVVTTLTRPGLQALIADLQSIDRQLADDLP